ERQTWTLGTELTRQPVRNPLVHADEPANPIRMQPQLKDHQRLQFERSEPGAACQHPRDGGDFVVRHAAWWKDLAPPPGRHRPTSGDEATSSVTGTATAVGPLSCLARAPYARASFLIAGGVRSSAATTVGLFSITQNLLSITLEMRFGQALTSLALDNSTREACNKNEPAPHPRVFGIDCEPNARCC